MNKLKKTLTQRYIAGAPGVVGKPGRPATKAYTIVKGEWAAYTYFAPAAEPILIRTRTGYKMVAGTWVTSIEWIDRSQYFSADPGEPPVKAIPPTRAQFRNNFNLGWNSGAYSTGTLSADGAFEFTAAPNTVGVVAGLNSNDSSPAYQDIDYGFYLNQGKFMLVEGGVQRGNWITYTAGDVFRVERVGERISYAQNSVFLASSPIPSTGLLLADSSLYSGGDSILDANFKTGAAFDSVIPQASHIVLQPLGSYGGDYSSSRAAVTLQPLTGAASGREAGNVGVASFQPLISRGANKQYSASVTKLGALVSAARGVVQIGVNARLQPIIGRVANKAYANSAGALSPLITEAHTSEFTPSYALSSTAFVQMTGASLGLTGEIGNAYVALKPAGGVGSDRPYGYSTARFVPMESYGVEFPVIDAYAVLALGKVSLVAVGTKREPNSFHGTLTSGYQLSAYAGSTAHMVMAKPKLAIEASFAVVGRSAMNMPMGTLEASGVAGAVGRAGMTLGTPTLRAFAGAVIKATLHDGFVLSASASQGGLGQAGNMTMPLFGLVATGLTGGVGQAELSMPMLRVAPSGKALLAMPGFELVAIGHAVVAVSYEAYAVTLNHDADQNEKRPGTMMVNSVTHYTDYPFNQILRFGNKYYGIGDTGIYVLEGDTDIGNPISWALETTLSDMGTPQKKRVVAASVGGRVTNLLNFTLVVGEAGTERYNYATPRSAAAQNYRQLFGKGVNARYVGFGLSDVTGQRFEMDTLGIEHYPLDRSI